MKKVWVKILLFWMPMQLSSQELFYAEYLAKVTSHLKTPESILANFRSPWFNEIQLRSETNQFSLDRQRFVVRLTPYPFGLGKIQTQWGMNMQAITLNEEKEYYARQVKDFVAQWLKASIYQKMLDELQQEQKLLADKKLIYQRLAQKSLDDLDNFLEVQHDIYAIEQKSAVLKNKREAIIKHWNQIWNLPFDLTLSSKLIGIDLIVKFVQQNDHLDARIKQAITNAMALEEKDLNLELAAERARKNQLLDFVQVRYRGPSQNIWPEKISVGVGLNLPLWGNDKFDVFEINFKKHNLQTEYDQKLNETWQEVMDLKNKINSAVNSFTLLSLQKEEISHLINHMESQPIEDISPLLMITQKSEIGKYNLRQWELTLEIFGYYLDLLKLADYFIPGQNYNYLEVLPAD